MFSRVVLGIVYLIGISCLIDPNKTRNDCRSDTNSYRSLVVWRMYCFWEAWSVLRSAVEQGTLTEWRTVCFSITNHIRIMLMFSSQRADVFIPEGRCFHPGGMSAISPGSFRPGVCGHHPNHDPAGVAASSPNALASLSNRCVVIALAFFSQKTRHFLTIPENVPIFESAKMGLSLLPPLPQLSSMHKVLLMGEIGCVAVIGVSNKMTTLNCNGLRSLLQRTDGHHAWHGRLVVAHSAEKCGLE